MYRYTFTQWSEAYIDIFIIWSEAYIDIFIIGQWQAAGNSAMHHYIRMHLSALPPSPSRPGHAGRHLISALFPAAHPITPHNLTSPLYFPLSTYILVEHPPPEYAQRLDWVRRHHMTREQHVSLTCNAVDTSGRSGRSCRIGVRACAAPTCISTQT